MTISRFFSGVVVETNVRSLTEPFISSDFLIENAKVRKNNILNDLAQIPFVGIAAGICRVIFSVFHVIAHTFAYLFNLNKGHFYQVIKGFAEMLRGGIESIPILGRIFASISFPPRSDAEHWWMVKIYNPDFPDALDVKNRFWRHFKIMDPQCYITA